MLTHETAVALLEPLAAMLRTDGYDLAVHVDSEELKVEVTATPSACAECLAPKELMAQIIKDALSNEHAEYGTREIHIAYPAD